MNRILSIIALLSFLVLFASWSNEDQVKVAKQSKSTVEDLAKQLEKKYQMRLINTGRSFFSNPYDKLWGFALMDSRKLTIEQARPIMVNMAQSFLQLLNQNKCFKIYLRNDKPKRMDPDKDPLYPLIAIKVAFWDQDVNRPPQPYVADMRFEDGKITYYVANPKDQSLQPQLVESLDEAVQKLQLLLQ